MTARDRRRQLTLNTSEKNPAPIRSMWKSSMRYSLARAECSAWYEVDLARPRRASSARGSSAPMGVWGLRATPAGPPMHHETGLTALRPGLPPPFLMLNSLASSSSPSPQRVTPVAPRRHASTTTLTTTTTTTTKRVSPNVCQPPAGTPPSLAQGTEATRLSVCPSVCHQLRYLLATDHCLLPTHV